MTGDTLIDQAGAIRAGEELDLDALRQYLEPLLGERARQLTVQQFPGGHSNLTYLLSSGDETWVLRRPPFGSKVKSAHDMSREYRVLSAIHEVFPYAPEPLHFCEDQAILGCDFYLMNYIRGLVIRREYPAELGLYPDQIRQQLLNFSDVLGQLHSIDRSKTALADFGRPEGYVSRQVEGWCRRWQDAVTPDTVNCDAIMQWLRDNRPAESGMASIIHNDYKLDNVIFSPEDPLKVIGVLDWEMATVGDPLMDLGCTLGYWVQRSDPEFFRTARTMPTDIAGAPTRAEIIERFQTRTGLQLDNFDFYFCFGLFRLTVIGQQIYYRYYHGLTKDERFVTFLHKSKALIRMCEMVIEGRVEH